MRLPKRRRLKVNYTKITHMKELQTELLDYQRKTEDIIESITDSFVALNSKWQYIHVNKAAEKLLNRSKKELIGNSIWDMFPDLLGTEFYYKLQQAMKDKQPTFFEMQGVYMPIIYEARVFPTEDGLVIYKKDITQQIKLKRELELSEERFAKAFDLSPAITAIISLDDKKYINVNDAWARFTGYSKVEIIGKEISSIDIAVDEETRNLRNINVYLGPIKDRLAKYLSKSGKVKEAILSSEIIEVQGCQCVLLFALDVSEIKHYEKEMIKLDKLNLIGQMAAGISHEVRNPMTIVRGFLQLLSSKEHYQVDKTTFDIMISELDRANEIITTFLSLSKEEGKDLKPQSINDIIDNIFPLLSAEAFNQDKELNLEMNPVPLVPLDENEIRQLILNLFNNALEAMEVGGCVTIKTYQDDDAVVLAIADEGIGIDPNTLAKLGTPFFTTKAEGTGLGLAVCYSIAARHDGTIAVESSDKGTIFSVSFPFNKK